MLDINNQFNVIFNDRRLHSIVIDENSTSVFQLWILRVKRKKDISSHFLYARVLPNSFKNDKWSSSDMDVFKPVNDDLSIQVLPLSLYASAHKVGVLISELLQGKTISESSEKANVKIDEKIRKRVGDFSVGKHYVVRPVMHLPTRDYFEFITSRIGPSSYQSYDSASFSINKTDFFEFDKEFSSEIAIKACELLEVETGQNFLKTDAWRLGDIELLNAPGIDLAQKEKYELSVKDVSTFKLHAPLHSDVTGYIILLKAYSDDCLLKVHATVLTDEPDYPYELELVTEEFKEIASAYTFEVYTQINGNSESYLSIHTGKSYMREVKISSNISGNLKIKDFGEWIKKGVSKSDLPLLEGASRVNRTTHRSNNTIGPRATDLWVRLNRGIETQISRYTPKKSGGRFFPRLSASRGKSRIELIEWLREIFERNSDANVIWIDPFMEDVGIDLLNRLGSSEGKYRVITGDLVATRYTSFKAKMKLKPSAQEPVGRSMTTKSKSVGGWAAHPRLNQKGHSTYWRSDVRLERDEEAGKPHRLQNMLIQCRNWSGGFGSVHLEIESLPHEKLHDRMILIRSKDGDPIEGFHLSNSIQRANDKHPLLITPIPMDTLPKVFSYFDELIQASDDVVGSSLKTIFDSTAFEESKRDNSNHSKLPWLMKHAGEVFSWWLSDPELSGLGSDALTEKLNSKNILVDNLLDQKYFSDIPNKLWIEGLTLTDFTTAWNVMGQLLAFSQAGQIYEKNQPTISIDLTKKLVGYLNSQRRDALPSQPRWSYIDVHHYLSLSLDELLMANANFDHIASDRSLVAYGDYYAIKLLWLRAAPALIQWMETEVMTLDGENIRQRTLLICTLGWISLSIYFNNDRTRMELLLKSKIPLVNWIGLNALSKGLEDCIYDINILSNQHVLVNKLFPYSFCFLIEKAQSIKSKNLTFLIAEFEKLLPQNIGNDQLTNILKYFRSSSGQLYGLKPWLLEHLLLPLLRSKKILLDQVTILWMKELIAIWEQAFDPHKSALFSIESDGAFSDELSMLYENSSSDVQLRVISELQSKFNDYARLLRKPLSRDVNYPKFSRAYHAIIWMLSVAYRLTTAEKNGASHELLSLIESCESIVEAVDKREMDWDLKKDIVVYLSSDASKFENNQLRNHIRLSVEKKTSRRAKK